jgi:hypothetical protein
MGRHWATIQGNDRFETNKVGKHTGDGKGFRLSTLELLLFPNCAR